MLRLVLLLNLGCATGFSLSSSTCPWAHRDLTRHTTDTLEQKTPK